MPEESQYQSAMSIGAMEATIRHVDKRLDSIEAMVRQGFDKAETERTRTHDMAHDRISKLRDDFKHDFDRLGTAVMRAAGIADRVDEFETETKAETTLIHAEIKAIDVRVQAIEKVIATRVYIKAFVQFLVVTSAAAIGAALALIRFSSGSGGVK